MKSDGSGRFTLKLYEGLLYKVSAARVVANKSAQSDYIEVPMALEQPRLVLPAQLRK